MLRRPFLANQVIAWNYLFKTERIEQLPLIIIVARLHSESPHNSESPFPRAINEFCNKICQKRSLLEQVVGSNKKR
jgi:hypothetical protein